MYSLCNQASDLAVAVNGDAVTECAGMQLPTLILENMSTWHSYWMLLYNQFNNNVPNVDQVLKVQQLDLS